VISQLPENSCHLIFDMWSTRQKESVIGVKLRYMRNWKIYHEVLAFKSFQDAHTGENIKAIVIDQLHKIFNLKPEQVKTNFTNCDTKSMSNNRDCLFWL